MSRKRGRGEKPLSGVSRKHRGAKPGAQARYYYEQHLKRKAVRNPGEKKMTKLQRLMASTKRAKEKRVAKALKTFLHAQNPAVKYDGAAIVKLKGGAVRITPIKASRGRKR